MGTIMTLKSRILSAIAAIAAFSAPAIAADMPMRMPPPPVAMVFNWTGFYVGVNGGYGWGARDDLAIRETFNGTPFVSGTWAGTGTFGALDAAGGFFGGQLGYNYQPVGTNWVFGFETDLQWSNIKGSRAATLSYVVAPSTITAAGFVELDWFGTLRGRIGYAWDRLMIYGTAGLAYGNSEFGLAVSTTLPPARTAAATVSSTSVGWVAGAGLEWAIAPNWWIKGEYQYINLGGHSVNTAETFVAGGRAAGFGILAERDYSFHTTRLGANYRS